MSAKRRGKRKRKRPAARPAPAGSAERRAEDAPAGAEAPRRAAAAARSRRGAAGDPPRPRRAPTERPPAPWGSAPLAELAILAGIVSLLIGVLGGHETAIGIGVGLAGLGGLEVAIREHLAGYRSHTTLLAGAAFVFTVALVFYVLGQILAVALGVGAAAFAVAFWLARRAFRRASGGLSFRVGGLRG